MDRIKYPSSPHLPWSPGRSVDREDKIMDPETLKRLMGSKLIAVSLKMDGENSTIYADKYTHARSIDSGYHESRTWLKAYAARISYAIQENKRLCGENLYAQHSLSYKDLPSYFLVFSAWAGDYCYSWGDTKSILSQINQLVSVQDAVHMVPEVYYGPPSGFDLEKFSEEFFSLYPDHEGFVVRNADSFNMSDFDKNLVKFVRAHHVQTDSHWMTQKVIPNGLIPKTWISFMP